MSVPFIKIVNTAYIGFVLWCLRHFQQYFSYTVTEYITWFIYLVRNMNTWTFHHFNGFLNYTSVFISRVYCCVSQTLQIINTYFIRFQSYCDASYSRGSVNLMWILKLFTGMLGYIQPWPFSSCNDINNLTSLPSTQLFKHSKVKDRLKEFQLCFIKRIANVDTNILS
jgi:hypothetical protein